MPRPPGDIVMKRHVVFALAVAFALALTGLSSLVGSAQQPAAPAAGPFDSLHFRQIGPASMSGRISRPRRLRGQPRHLLRRHGSRRRVEDRQQRHDVRGAVPGPGPDVHRRRRRLAVEPGPGLGRHRRVQQPPEHVVGRRRLQVHRRRQDLHQHGAAHLPPHQPRRHRSPRQQRGLRRGDRQPVGRRAASAASTRRPTAARRGSRC